MWVIRVISSGFPHHHFTSCSSLATLCWPAGLDWHNSLACNKNFTNWTKNARLQLYPRNSKSERCSHNYQFVSHTGTGTWNKYKKTWTLWGKIESEDHKLKKSLMKHEEHVCKSKSACVRVAFDLPGKQEALTLPQDLASIHPCKARTSSIFLNWMDRFSSEAASVAYIPAHMHSWKLQM